MSTTTGPNPAVSNQRSLAKYRKKARFYDTTTGRTSPLRVRTIDLLQLQPGDIVLDAGCGTGLSFALLLEGVGAGGQVVGIDQSPQMCALARQRVQREGWPNVTVIEGIIETTLLQRQFDALLFNYAHDISRTRAAIKNIFDHAKPGARVAVAGMKFFPWWTGPLNIYAFCKNYAWNGLRGGLWRPWDIIQRYVPDLEVRATQLGMGYVAHGQHKK